MGTVSLNTALWAQNCWTVQNYSAVYGSSTLQRPTIHYMNIIFAVVYIIIKGKAVPLQAWSGPQGSRKLRFPDYMTAAQDGGKVVSQPYAPSAFTPRKCSRYSFLSEAESTPWP
jgi:hypothetical protein